VNLDWKRDVVAAGARGVARSSAPLSSLVPGEPSFLMPAEAETALEENLPVAKGETTI
jgi:hypothetical protein